MKEEKIIIYGAGLDCRRILEMYPELIERVECIVDGDVNKVGTVMLGIPVKSSQTIKTLGENEEVLISSKKYFEEIKSDIQKLNKDVEVKLLTHELISDYLGLPIIGICSSCQKEIRRWFPAGKENHTVYSIIGNGRRNSRCGFCDSIDRYRWVDWVLENQTAILSSECKILHFAPERNIENKIRKYRNTDYYTADIQKGRADYVVDITDICFADSMFDYVIANHVLEHIADEKKAINELKRVLKGNGKIILSFPICMQENTLEKDEYNTEELRKKYYGQSDHVRLYGKDYKERLEKYGLKIKCYSPNAYLSWEQIEKYKLIPNDIVIIGECADAKC